MKNKLVLKDGTEIIDGFASKSSRNQLMIRIPGNSIAQAAIEFSNPEKTETIISYYSIYKTTYVGYTEMYTIQYYEDSDYIEIWLKSAEDAETSTTEEIIVPGEYVPYEIASEEVHQEVTENE